MGFLSGAVVKNLPTNAGDARDTSLFPGLGRSPGGEGNDNPLWLGRSPGGEGNDNPLWYSFLGNLMDRGVWWATVPGATKELDMTE